VLFVGAELLLVYAWRARRTRTTPPPRVDASLREEPL
jgi:hypothetical protein